MWRVKGKRMKQISLLLAIYLAFFQVASTVQAESGQAVQTNEVQDITSMAPAGPTTIQVGFDGGVGFQFPNINNGAAFQQIKHDLALFVKQGDEWVSIDNNAASGWIYDVNFGNWWEGPGGYWFNPVEETTVVKVASKSNPSVAVEYTLNVTPANPQEITSMAPAGATTLDVSPSGGVGFEFPRFNSGATFKDVKNDVALFVKQGDEWVSIDQNAASGWIYDQNFGNWWEGPGGYWFNPVEETTVFRVASKANPDVFVDYTLKVTVPVRNSHVISNFDGRTTFEADQNGAVALPVPKIDGGSATKSEVDKFVYEVKVDGEWVNILESAATGFTYSPNGYNNQSSATQWGYWTDHIFGLWFQPVQEDVSFRAGYPLNGEKGGEIGSNYVEYTLIGNPDAFRPDDVVLDDIPLGTSEESALEGWDLVWNDEFNGTELDESKWNYSTGYYLNEDPGTWGWGNNEMQHYTDDEDNVFVEDGKLNIVALDDPKSFPQDPDRVAPYSSGKITTQDKFAFTYGRVDFSAKLPAVTGAWPALWMLPNDNVYGEWASSGEIDVMEARGRLPESTSGAIHYGGEWPLNTYLSGEQTFEDGGRIDTDYHVYSLIWEEDSLNWYVDGKFFYRVTKDQWFSAAAKDNPNAPFDQDFYLIMNLALGGWFDGGREPSVEDFPLSMQVDYVRVYEEQAQEEPPAVPVTGVSLNKSDVELTAAGQRTTLMAAVTPANATNKKVTWSSDNPEVATVTAGGVVTAVKNGTAVITAVTEDGSKSASANVVVAIVPQMTAEQQFPLTNGTFAEGKTGWSAWSVEKEDAYLDNVRVENGQATLAIPAAEGKKQDVQLKQGDLTLVKGKAYVVSFDASSSVPREMEWLVESVDGKQAGSRVALTEETKRYTYSFTATGDEAGSLAFLAGNDAKLAAHSITLDNVVLEMKDPAANKVKNGTFNDGGTSWSLWSDTGATSAVKDGQTAITIPSIGNEFWSIQFSQLGLPLEKDASYRLVFDAASTSGRSIDTIIESAGYEKYLWETVKITEDNATYAVEFTHDHAADPSAKLVFALGKVAGQESVGEHTVTLDNVHLYKIPNLPADNPAEPEPEREGYGVGKISADKVEFYVNDAPWAIIHYSKNGETQQNVMMTKTSDNYSVFTLDNMKEGDIISYGFTYGLADGGQAEYAKQTYIHKVVTAPDAPTADDVTDQSTEVTGKAAAGALITVKIGEERYTGKVDANGSYTVTIPAQKAGTVLLITATDEAGNESKALEVTVLKTEVPETPDSFVVNGVSDHSKAVTGLTETGVTVAVQIGTKKKEYTASVKRDGTYSVKIPKQKAGTALIVTVKDKAGKTIATKNVTVLDRTAPAAPTVDKVTASATAITGKTEPNATVTVKVGKKVIGTAMADAKGKFSITIPKQKTGTELTITATDEAGNVSKAKTMNVKK